MEVVLPNAVQRIAIRWWCRKLHGSKLSHKTNAVAICWRRAAINCFKGLDMVQYCSFYHQNEITILINNMQFKTGSSYVSNACVVWNQYIQHWLTLSKGKLVCFQAEQFSCVSSLWNSFNLRYCWKICYDSNSNWKTETSESAKRSLV